MVSVWMLLQAAKHGSVAPSVSVSSEAPQFCSHGRPSNGWDNKPLVEEEAWINGIISPVRFRRTRVRLPMAGKPPHDSVRGPTSRSRLACCRLPTAASSSSSASTQATRNFQPIGECCQDEAFRATVNAKGFLQKYQLFSFLFLEETETRLP